ncbi:hypothetical protein HYV49_06410 [Candidatus Pacearchaeota archaeon]|nr:hypothetical protein [Candidatus Pacearchaeota archaeon]
MTNIFEVFDKTGRKIRLTKERWSYILQDHYDMINYLYELQKNLINPIKITSHKKGNLRNYYTYLKYRRHPAKFLKLIC